MRLPVALFSQAHTQGLSGNKLHPAYSPSPARSRHRCSSHSRTSPPVGNLAKKFPRHVILPLSPITNQSLTSAYLPYPLFYLVLLTVRLPPRSLWIRHSARTRRFVLDRYTWKASTPATLFPHPECAILFHSIPTMSNFWPIPSRPVCDPS